MIATIRGWILAFFRRIRGDEGRPDALVEVATETPLAEHVPIGSALDVLTKHIAKIPGASVRRVVMERSEPQGSVVVAVVDDDAHSR